MTKNYCRCMSIFIHSKVSYKDSPCFALKREVTMLCAYGLLPLIFSYRIPFSILGCKAVDIRFGNLEFVSVTKFTWWREYICLYCVDISHHWYRKLYPLHVYKPVLILCSKLLNIKYFKKEKILMVAWFTPRTNCRI